MRVFSVFSLFGDQEKKDKQTLSEGKLLLSPSVTVAECNENIIWMARLVQDTAFIALGLVESYSAKKAGEVEENSIRIIQYEEELENYLMEAVAQELSETDSREVSRILSVIHEFERVGNHVWGISRTVTEMQEESLGFAEKAQRELILLQHAVEEVISMSITAYLTEDLELAKEVEPLEEVIKYLCIQLKSQHIKGLHQCQCTVEQSRCYQEILNNFARISDYCSNIAIGLIREQEDDYDPHGYLAGVTEAERLRIQERYKYYREKYTKGL